MQGPFGIVYKYVGVRFIEPGWVKMIPCKGLINQAPTVKVEKSLRLGLKGLLPKPSACPSTQAQGERRYVETI
jgi:hypothetical protein